MFGGEAMNVAIYARQSVDKKESISIDTQIVFCKKECDTEDSVFIYKDRGYSGKNTKRPEFQRLLEDVKLGKISRVIVYRLDRLSRSIVDFSLFWEVLEQKKVSFSSVNEKFDTSTPMGKAMIYIIMIFAQLERETISERVKDNYYERIKSGSWPGGPAPYGFKIGRTQYEGKKVPTLTVDDTQIEMVKRIFEEYTETTISLGKIAKTLSEEGIPRAKRSTWDNISLARILHSPLYVKADINVYSYYKEQGVKIVNDITEFDGSKSGMLVGKRRASDRKYTSLEDHVLVLTNFSGVINSETWIRCQYKLNHNSQIKNAGQGKYTWLTGLLKCKNCGYSIVVKKYSTKKAGEQKVFACSGRSNQHVCNISRLNASINEVEKLVQAEIEKVLDQFKGEETDFVDAKDANLQMELVKIEEKIEKLVDLMVEAETVSMEYINKKLAELDKQKRKVLDSLQKKAKKDRNIMSEIIFENLDIANKHLVAEQFIQKILLSDEEVEIVWKV